MSKNTQDVGVDIFRPPYQPRHCACLSCVYGFSHIADVSNRHTLFVGESLS